MNLLCFDISSGGITAALLTEELEPTRTSEGPWKVASLSAEGIVAQFREVTSGLKSHQVDAVCIGTFMHNCVVLDAAEKPLTPVFTWQTPGGERGIEVVRRRIGDRFHERTGCRYHPMFPIFKLASMQLEHAKRVVSIKAFLTHRLSGTWIEDHGIASASGLYNIHDNDWDDELLALAGLTRGHLPPVSGRNEIIGELTPAAAQEFGLPVRTPVVNGSGDGFLANVGSDCEVPSKISVTLGTSAVARQTLPAPILDSKAGTFCYQADENAYLLGCAGSNGGNVLDWGRKIFGTLENASTPVDLPIFIPLLHGERSPDWNPELTGSWHLLKALHSAADLSRSVLEGVVFNLAHFVEIVQKTSGEDASSIVLSGNGFLHPLAAPILAAVAGIPVSMPSKPGLASLRGAGICCLRALGAPVPKLSARQIDAIDDPKILDRYGLYRRFRSTL